VSDNDEVFTFHPDGSMTQGPPEFTTAEFVNDVTQTEARAVAKGDNPNRLLYVTGSLEQDVRISGKPTVELTITPHGDRGQVGVALVDYGTAVRVADDGLGNKTLETESCWGESTSYDDACYFDSVENLVSTELGVIGRGWARLTANQSNTLTVDLAYNDVVVPAGHQLGLAIFAASPEFVLSWDFRNTPYSVELGVSSLTIPVVGDIATAGNAGDLSQVPAHVPPWTLPNPAELRVP
jgi:X-Pro dipeptidyl-peptidase